jgi:hypothetical protein
MKEGSRPATASEIVAIVGPLDDAVVMSILNTGATPEEVLEAFTRATSDDQIGTETERTSRGRVAAVCDILQSVEAEQEEPD